MAGAVLIVLAVLILIIIRLYLYREDFKFQNDRTTWLKRSLKRVQYGFKEWRQDKSFALDVIAIILTVVILTALLILG